MRVPPIDTFGRFGVSKCIGKKTNNSTNLSMIKPIRQDTVTFGSTAQYLKKYSTLPDEIKRKLSPEDAIDMFREMEWLAQGRIKGTAIGKTEATSLYQNPWLEDYYLLIVRNCTGQDDDGDVVICYKDRDEIPVWKDSDNSGIRLLKRFG